jgi:hypothetical protein
MSQFALLAGYSPFVALHKNLVQARFWRCGGNWKYIIGYLHLYDVSLGRRARDAITYMMLPNTAFGLYQPIPVPGLESRTGLLQKGSYVGHSGAERRQPRILYLTQSRSSFQAKSNIQDEEYGEQSRMLKLDVEDEGQPLAFQAKRKGSGRLSRAKGAAVYSFLKYRSSFEKGRGSEELTDEVYQVVRRRDCLGTTYGGHQCHSSLSDRPAAQYAMDRRLSGRCFRRASRSHLHSRCLQPEGSTGVVAL